MSPPGRPLRRLLVADDDGDLRELLVLALQEVGGFEVRAVASGLEALTEAAAWGPDLLLLDARMPGMDGPATLAALRAAPATAALPVFFLTARKDAPGRAELRSCGADGLLEKPFDPMALPDQLRRLWEELPLRP